MISELSKKKAVAFNPIHHSMFISYAPRPESGECMLQWLRLPNTRKWFSFDLLNQLINPFDHLSVLLLPIEVVIPSFVRKDELHFTRVRSVPLPSASCETAAKSLLALVGLRNRYEVSSNAL